MADFEKCVKYVLRNEGGFVNDKYDSGGATKYGITLYTLKNYRGKRKVTVEDIQNLTKGEAQQIYFEKYWRPLWCPRIKSDVVALFLFDTGVLYGLDQAVTFAQKAANDCGSGIDIDGQMGPITAVAIENWDELKWGLHFILYVLDRIDLIVKKYPKNEKFKEGWRNRARRLLSQLNS